MSFADPKFFSLSDSASLPLFEGNLFAGEQLRIIRVNRKKEMNILE
ncbi:MAG: hypothetical protein M5T52_03635 [Ignavibacteriaceae bacterium]|nr:hypothetical protein [Ignavibacteriaceae bacterium]